MLGVLIAYADGKASTRKTDSMYVITIYKIKTQKNSMNFNSTSVVVEVLFPLLLRCNACECVVVVVVIRFVFHSYTDILFWIAAIYRKLSHHYKCCMRSSAMRVIIVANFFFVDISVFFFSFYCFIFAVVRSLFIWSFFPFAVFYIFNIISCFFFAAHTTNVIFSSFLLFAFFSINSFYEVWLIYVVWF